MRGKSFFIHTVLLLLTSLIIISTVQIAIDPCFQYHLPLFGMEPVLKNERYQNPGVAKNFDFDNTIIGNSMSENFSADDFSEIYGGKTVKLTSAGSHPLDWTFLFEILLRREKPVNHIILNLDKGVMDSSIAELKEELPTFLYDDNILNDVEYWLNFSVIKSLTIRCVFDNLSGTVVNPSEAYVWDHGAQCGQEKVLTAYCKEKGMDEPESEKIDDEQMELAINNMKLVGTYIERMPDTTFTFFVSPFSMLYWKDIVNQERVDAIQAMYTESIKYLLQYGNVEVFLMDDELFLEMMADLENYRDTTHFSKKMSDLIAQCIGENKGIVGTDEVETRIENYFNYIREYDYSVFPY